MLWLNIWEVSIKRLLGRGGLGLPLFSLLTLLSFTLQAAGPYQEGKHYLDLAPEQAQIETEQAISVQHWFWYGCASCALFSQQIPQLQAADLEWHSYPAQLRDSWYFHAKAFHYAAQQENQTELEQALFKTLSLNSQALASQDELLDWFAQQGLDRDLVKDAITSPLLNQKLAQEVAMQQHWQIRGVPALVIDNRYLVDAGRVHSLEEFVAVVQFLLQQARQNRVPEQAKLSTFPLLQP